MINQNRETRGITEEPLLRECMSAQPCERIGRADPELAANMSVA
jgi:hypothetical protein